MFLQIESNKRWSVVLMLACIGLFMAVAWVFEIIYQLPHHLGLFVAFGLALILGLVSYFRGGDIVLTASNASPVTHNEQPQLFNVVEEMSIAAGIPMPQVYLIHDTSPNAFATGRDPQDAKIAITTGLLEKLNRDELQGVIAHEMAHIRNYDTLFMTLITVMVGTIALFGDAIWHSRHCYLEDGDNHGSDARMLIALPLLMVAPIASKLIQLAASRKREYLADASAALLTRYPLGLASALRKLTADPASLACANRATQHMYIVNPLKGEGGSSAWDTHPPLEERIKRLEKMAFQNSAPEHTRRIASPQAASIPVSTMPLAVSSLPQAVTTVAIAGAAAGPTVAAFAPTPTNACPRCSEKLKRGKISGQSIAGCKSCGGVWIGEAEFNTLLQQAPKKLIAADDLYPNRLGSDWQSFADKRCPVCDTALKGMPLPSRSHIIIDRCEQGHGIWFDDGELAAAVQKRATAST